MAFTYESEIQTMYIAYFGRPADPAGLQYWDDVLVGNSGDLQPIIDEFSNTAEYADLFAGNTNTEIVESIYQSSFGRAAEADGLEYWVGQLDSGAVGIGDIVWAVVFGAQGTDVDVVDVKVAAASAFTAALDTQDEMDSYNADDAASIARAWLNGVVDAAPDATDVDAAVASLPVIVPPPVVVDGDTIYLTSGTDRGGIFDGTDDNDQFNAYIEQNAFAGGVSNSLSSADVLDGGLGTDTLYAEIVPEFYSASSTNLMDIQPRTSNIENVEFEARDTIDLGTLIGTAITVDAKHMIDVDKIGSTFSDGDLVIENLTTLQTDGDPRNTDEITITMDHTDNFNSDGDASDLTVYFDEDYLLAGQSRTTSQANYWLLDEDSLDYVAEPLLNIERNGVTLTIDGVAYEIKMADDVAADADTWTAFAAGLQGVIDASDIAAFEGLTVAVDVTNTDETYNDAGALVTIPAITITDAAGRDIVPTGFTSPEETTDAFDIYGRMDNVGSGVFANPLAVGVELDKVGREGEGGDLTIGGKELDSDAGREDQGHGIGTFNIDVLGDASRLSNLGVIQSTNGDLTTVNIATATAFQNGDTFASLTVRDSFGRPTDLQTVNANTFLGDLAIGEDTRALNVDTFTATGGGDVTLYALLDGNQKGVFTNVTGSGNDTLDFRINGDAFDTVGTSFSINAGGGNNNVNVRDISNEVSVLTTAMLNNLSILTGSGVDTVELIGGSAALNPLDGDADFNITTGGGSDMVYINSIDDVAGTLLAARGMWTTGDVDGTAPNTFVNRVLYKATLTVNFAGFEETVEVATTSAGNFVATQVIINEAIMAAIDANAELSRLLTYQLTTGSQQLVINSTVEGDNDLAIDLFQANLSAVPAVGLITFVASDLAAVQAGLMATSHPNDSDATDTAAEVIAIINGMGTFLDETGAPGVVYDVLASADAPPLANDGMDETNVTNVSTIDMGSGANDLVVLNSDDLSANTLMFSDVWGKVSVVNFFTDQAVSQDNATAQATNLIEGLHMIDFTHWLDDLIDPSATPDILSALRVATTDADGASASFALVSNGVVIVNDFVETATESWSGLTASELQTALNGLGNFANIGAHAGAAAPAGLIGTNIDTMIMIENDLNAGEYAVFNAETTNLATTDDVTVTLVGVIDFGAQIDAAGTLFV